jgi:hypothetical protein
MDIRKFVSLFALFLLVLGLSLLFWTFKSTWAQSIQQPLACGCTADEASPDDYARIIKKALESKKPKGGNF